MHSENQNKNIYRILNGHYRLSIDLYVFIGKRHSSENIGDRYGNRASNFRC